MQGERPLREIGGSALDVLATALEAPVGALYASEGPEQTLIATRGLRSGADVPATFAPGEGIVGEAARAGADHGAREPLGRAAAAPHRDGAGRPAPRRRLPAGRRRPHRGSARARAAARRPSPRGLELLERARDGIAVALRSAFYRTRLQVAARGDPASGGGAADAAGGAARRQRGARGAEQRAAGVAGPPRAAAGRARGDQRAARRRRPRSSRGGRRRCSRSQGRGRAARASTSPSSSPTCRTSCARR